MTRLRRLDQPGTAVAITLLEQVRAGALSGDDIDNRWPATDDMLLRSIHFWLWTLFDDFSDARVVIEPGSPEERILDNCLRFLHDDAVFAIRPRGTLAEWKRRLRSGVEWKGCELPWHDAWPYPPAA